MKKQSIRVSLSGFSLFFLLQRLCPYKKGEESPYKHHTTIWLSTAETVLILCCK